MKKDQFIQVEAEDDPGVIKRYLVRGVNPDGSVVLLHQGEYRVMPHTKGQLIAFMRDNDITQEFLAKMIGKSRSTVSRYLNGDTEVPKWVYDLLGIRARRTDAQQEARMEQLIKKLVVVQSSIDKLITEWKEGL